MKPTYTPYDRNPDLGRLVDLLGGAIRRTAQPPTLGVALPATTTANTGGDAVVRGEPPRVNPPTLGVAIPPRRARSPRRVRFGAHFGTQTDATTPGPGTLGEPPSWLPPDIASAHRELSSAMGPNWVPPARTTFGTQTGEYMPSSDDSQELQNMIDNYQTNLLSPEVPNINETSAASDDIQNIINYYDRNVNSLLSGSDPSTDTPFQPTRLDFSGEETKEESKLQTPITRSAINLPSTPSAYRTPGFPVATTLAPPTKESEAWDQRAQFLTNPRLITPQRVEALQKFFPDYSPPLPYIEDSNLRARVDAFKDILGREYLSQKQKNRAIKDFLDFGSGGFSSWKDFPTDWDKYTDQQKINALTYYLRGVERKIVPTEAIGTRHRKPPAMYSPSRPTLFV